ncbi:MAG TPA: endolytic transglycosylase MltG, partial [Candidatus Hydrogenedentes bacterium]|nr:endolytic transglycosylase MltG [Candidatus Hydrogenedentota bacterium]
IEQASKLFGNPAAFVEAASDPKLIARIGIKATTLEGFLLPNTYYFDRKPTEREVVERMIAEFEKQYASLIAQSPPPEGFDKLAIVTIASLIEEEARVPEERPSVAAVIYNRLQKNMPLQFDSTLQFALKKYGQRLLYEDLETDSPYNTYKHTGLPPGPISSPGTAALKAALRPARADFLYFVSNADGQTHTFSATEAEHLKAVARFRKEIAPQRKKQDTGENPQ